MSLYVGQKVDNPQEFNDNVRAVKGSPYSGCVSTWACVKCHHLITDSICLCVGIFDCPKCGHANGDRPLMPLVFNQQLGLRSLDEYQDGGGI